MTWDRGQLGIFAILPLMLLARPASAGAQLTLEHQPLGLEVEVSGWIQPRYELDRTIDGSSGRFSLRRLRLDSRGRVLDPRLTFRIQSDLLRRGRLRDLYVDYAFSEGLAVRLGKYSVPFEWRVSPRRDAFTDRDIATSTFGAPSRDIGLLLHGSDGDRRVEYALGVLDGNGGGLSPRSGGMMGTARGAYAVIGSIPNAETDYERSAVGNLAIGAGGQVARRNALSDWSLGRSTAGDTVGDWRTIVFDVVAQRRGLAATVKHYERYVSPADPGVRPYNGRATAVSFVAAVVPRVEVVGRRAWSEIDDRDPATREADWAVGLNVYHRGHDAKSRLHYGGWKTASHGAEAHRILTAEISLQF